MSDAMHNPPAVTPGFTPLGPDYPTRQTTLYMGDTIRVFITPSGSLGIEADNRIAVRRPEQWVAMAYAPYETGMPTRRPGTQPR